MTYIDISQNSKRDGYQRELVSMIYNFFHKNASSVAIMCRNKSNIKS